MAIPQRTLSGTCEISTGAVTVTNLPPAFMGEVGALKISVAFTNGGTAYSIPTGTKAQMYLYYASRDQMTPAVDMAVSGATATGNLGIDDTAVAGAPLLVVQLVDTAAGTLTVACAVSMHIQRVRGEIRIHTSPPTPSEIVYVGRAPYVAANNHWMIWDNDTAQYVDSGVEATGKQGPQGVIGPIGPRGPIGPTGATPKLTIGTVTTGAPGTAAQAVITGAAENPVLGLTIPRGDAGGVQTVNGHAPNAAGGVTLSAADVGARPITWMPSASDVGAYPAGGIRRLAVSIPVSGWTGVGPYSTTISDATITANTDILTFVLTPETRRNMTAYMQFAVSAGGVVLTTPIKPVGEIAGYMQIAESEV